MKRNIIAIVTLIAIASAAHARNDGGPSNNNGPTFGGTTTVTANPSAAAVAGASAHSQATGIGTGVGFGGAGGAGGQGGAGGAGGSATAVGLGGNVHSTIGNTNSVRNDVSSTNINANSNQQGQHQGQGQQQGQLQGQQQQAVSNSGGNRLTNEGNNAAQTTKVTVEGDTYEAAKIPVATAYAPMVNNTANCAIGVSGGIQAATWGISGGSAFESETCVTIEQAKVAKVVFNDVATGEELMCSLAKYREARKSAGRPCNADKKAAAAPGAQQTATYEPTDPIVRARIGLPPLSK